MKVYISVLTMNSNQLISFIIMNGFLVYVLMTLSFKQLNIKNQTYWSLEYNFLNVFFSFHTILGDALTPNRWIEYFSSSDNRHALPLFTSLLNVVCSYDPVGMGLPYNHLIFTDSREALVESALQVLVVVLDHDTNNSTEEDVRYAILNLSLCVSKNISGPSVLNYCVSELVLVEHIGSFLV